MEPEDKRFTIDWIEPDRAFSIIVHTDQLTKDDVAAMQADTSVRYLTATRNLHAIIDLTRLGQLPTENVDGSLSSIRTPTERNRGETIIIVSPSNHLVKFMAGATMEGLRKTFLPCHTMEEALEILAGLD
jgi:hypothetical protein